MARYVFSA